MSIAMNESDEKSANQPMKIQTENIAYAADELVTCPKCARTNPPTRSDCFYCGAGLEVPEELARRARPSLRALEAWEPGFNIVVETATDPDSAAVARLLKCEREFVDRVVGCGRAVPIIRVESAPEADIIRGELALKGIEARIVSDDSLAVETPPRRLRAIEFGESRFRLYPFNDDTVFEIAADAIDALVTGAIFEKAVTATEKRKKGKTRMLDASETASDEPLLDIYVRDDPFGFRILTAGFDFSCLGDEKTMIARDNLRRLAAKLAETSGGRLVDDYVALRAVLGEVWEVDVRKDSQGMKRSSFGKFDLVSVSKSSNLNQFNKFSRLQRQLI